MDLFITDSVRSVVIDAVYPSVSNEFRGAIDISSTGFPSTTNGISKT
ncbi:MAG: hypothetical protein R3A12_12580 [Ignavibacteria bacterium]